MRKTLLSLLLIPAALIINACAVQPVPVAVSTSYDGNPCNQSYFDAVACQSAIQLGGWYLNGVLIHHYYGGYGYNYYYNQNRVYISHGGHVVPYRSAVTVIQSRPAAQPYTSTSVNSASKPYVPPSQRPAGYNPASRSYTPPSQRLSASAPSSTPTPSRSYSPPSRPASSYSPPSSRSRK